MLSQMRRSADTWAVRAMLIVFMIAFASWGMLSYLSPSAGGAYAAMVGGDSIPLQLFERRLNNYKARLQHFGQVVPEEGTPEAKKMARDILDMMVAEKLVERRVEDLGLQVGDESLKRDVASKPYFADDKGIFSETVFLNALRNAGTNKRLYFASRRKELSANLLKAAFNFVPDFPERLMKRIHNRRFEERVVDVTFVPYGAVEPKGEPQETELQQLYQENSRLFRVPEYREITYFTISPADVKKEINVKDAELKRFYTDRKESYKIPQTREALQYRFDSREEAEKAFKILNAVVGKHKDGKAKAPPSMLFADNRQDLGVFSASELPSSVADAAFKADAGTLTPPTQTPFGWSILYVKRVISKHQGAFEEVKDRVKDEYVRRQVDDRYPDFLHRVEDKLAEGMALKDIAKDFGFKLQAFTVDKDGKTEAGDETDLSEMGAAKLLESAFAAKDKNVSSQLIPLGSDGTEYAIYALTSIKHARTKAFDEVKGKTLDLWKKKNRAAALLKEAEQAKARGELLPDLFVKTYPEAKYEKGVYVRRSGKDGGFPQMRTNINDRMADAVFAADIGEQVVSYNDESEQLMVAKVTKKRDGADGAAKEVLDAVRMRWRESFASDFVEQYLRFLKKEYTVRYNQELL